MSVISCDIIEHTKRNPSELLLQYFITSSIMIINNNEGNILLNYDDYKTI